MNDLIFQLAAVFVGLAGGIAVGSGMVAFLIVLDIIPRLVQLSRSPGMIRWYEFSVISGSLLFTIIDFFDWRMEISIFFVGIFGLFAGGFIGMLAGALTEIINVLPILAKRVGLEEYMIGLLMAMVLGKVLGSLFEWLLF